MTPSGGFDLFQIEAHLDTGAVERLRAIAVGDTLHGEEVPVEQTLQQILQKFESHLDRGSARAVRRQLQEPGADADSLLRDRQKLLEARRRALGLGRDSVR